MLPPMISYAQNAEDVVLRRVFFDCPTGFYVDIGACDPVEDSVTKHFYDHGWRGVNVEPDVRLHAALAAARPRDVNICAAVGRNETPITFYPTKTRGHGTLDPALATERSEAAAEVVPQITLARILAENAPEGVDFLKVDVEGWELEVLSSADWTQVTPRVVVVEAIDLSGQASYEPWESILLDAGYKFGLFDGVNRFYCRREDAEKLLPRLAAPGNVLDNWRLARELRAQADSVASHQAELQRLSGLLAEQNATLTAQNTALIAEHTAHAMTRSALNAEQVSHGATRDALRVEHTAHTAALDALRAEQRAHGATQAAHDATRDALRAEQVAHAATRSAMNDRQKLIEALQGSTSWRITAPIRNFKQLASLVRPGG